MADNYRVMSHLLPFSVRTPFASKTAASLPTSLLPSGIMVVVAESNWTSQESLLTAVEVIDNEMNPPDAPRQPLLMVRDFAATHVGASFRAASAANFPRSASAYAPLA